MAEEYWQERLQRQSDKIAEKTEREINEQLAKYYKQAMKGIISECEATYAKVLEAKAEGKEVTPAWLYSLDRYNQMQAALREEAQKLGDREVAIMSKKFEKEWEEVYKASALPSDFAFAKIPTPSAKSMIESVWCADGKNFKDRVWTNKEKLIEMLNDELVHCAVTGKKTTELRDKLMETFGADMRKANRLVRTEISHIQTAAQVQKWKEYGVTHYKFLGRDKHEDKMRCECANLDGKIISFDEAVQGKTMPPLHPSCRCSCVPVVPDSVSVPEEKKATPAISEERKKELLEKTHKVRPLDNWVARQFEQYKRDKNGNIKRDRNGKIVMLPLPLKEMFLKQLETTSRKLINKGEKREIREMIADWPDSMFKQCGSCGRVFAKSKPNANAAKLCPECQAEKRKADRAEYKKKENAALKTKRRKAKWARQNRAKKKEADLS